MLEEAILEEAEFYNVAGMAIILFWEPTFCIHPIGRKNYTCSPILFFSDMVKVLKERIHSRDNSFGKSNGKHVYRYKFAMSTHQLQKNLWFVMHIV